MSWNTVQGWRFPEECHFLLTDFTSLSAEKIKSTDTFCEFSYLWDCPKLKNFSSLNDIKRFNFCPEEDALPLCEITIFLYVQGIKSSMYFTESGNFIVLHFENCISELFPFFTRQVWQLRQIGVASVLCWLALRICFIFLEVYLVKVFPKVELFFLISLKVSTGVEGIVVHWNFNSGLIFVE